LPEKRGASPTNAARSAERMPSAPITASRERVARGAEGSMRTRPPRPAPPFGGARA
jgi:hypothetical protein